MTIYKMCSDCYQMKPIDSFHTDKTGAAMVRGNCKVCECFKRRQRYVRASKNWREKMKSAITLVVFLGLFASCEAASTDTIVDIDQQITAINNELLRLAVPEPQVPVEQKVVEIHMTKHASVPQEVSKKARKKMIQVVPLPGHGTCSGSFIGNEGEIITARHCVDDFDSFEVQTYDNRIYVATVISTSTTHDLAIIRIDRNNTPYFKLAKSVTRGEKIFVLGSPLGITDTLSTGVVARLVGDAMLLDCGVLPGNSGGPVFNQNQELVGVVNAGFIVLFGMTHLNIAQSLDAVHFFIKEVASKYADGHR